jgi:hypothetical protein
MATVNFTETVKYDGIDVPTDRLIELFREHAADVLEELVGEVLGEALSDKAPYDIDTYGPILDALRADATAQGIEPDREDIVEVTYEA